MSDLRDRIFTVLREHRLSNMTFEGTDDPFCLVDLVSTPGSSISTGEEELFALADEIAFAVARPDVTPTLQASDLDAIADPAEIALIETWGRGEGLGSILSSVHRACAAIVAQRDAVSAQLAAEKARADKAEGEATKLQNYRQLHGGDVLSLSNDLAIEHEQVEELSAQLAAAEANLAAANKQIEEMRGAREQAIEEAAQVADARKGPREDYGYDAGFNNACEFIARAIRARTALPHEARNG